MNRPALIVDDNDDYTKMLLTHLEPKGYQFDRARSASEGLERLRLSGRDHYRLIITDITMEGQTAGMKLIRRMRSLGYDGIIMVASTGFNLPIFLHLLRPFMALWGVDILIPKKPLKTGYFQCSAVSPRGRDFLKAKEGHE